MAALLRSAVPVLALAVALAATAQTAVVQRCESKDGRVTYSNTACPDGTVPVRKVNTAPPVSVEERNAAQDRARKDSAAVKQIVKEQSQQDVRDRKQADERAKTDAKAKERCENARRELDRSKTSRTALNAKVSTAEKLQKAELEINRREAEVARECKS